ncbi:UNVERIFIED_ORG: hypothetical protein QFZ59_000563 [Bacillus sp. B2I3]|nr:hypothetical protein [Bacillus sp. B2I3]
MSLTIVCGLSGILCCKSNQNSKFPLSSRYDEMDALLIFDMYSSLGNEYYCMTTQMLCYKLN